MKKLLSSVALGLCLAVSGISIANAEVVLGGYSFNDPTPKHEATGVSATNNRIIVLPLSDKASKVEKRNFTNVDFIAGKLKPTIITMNKTNMQTDDCKKRTNEVYNYLRGKYSDRGFKDVPVMRGYFAAVFDPDQVKFSQFVDNGKLYDVTVGCLEKDGSGLNLFAQIELD